MDLRFGGALAALLIVAGASTGASAQDQYCLDQVEEICGNEAANSCFADESAWDELDDACIADAQTLVELAREAQEQEADVLETGLSYGGVLRRGPSASDRRLGSLQEGDWLEVLEPTGEWYDGYQWYYVNTRLGEGYHWGGIFCTRDPLEGVLTTCSEGY